MKADGSRHIGPNDVVVPGPYVYSGAGFSSIARLERPLGPKAKLFASSDFLSHVAAEWESSLSKKAMCARVRRFVPGLSPGFLNRRAVFGVRSSVIGRSGFIPEALVLKGECSFHVINCNSPGASGAPAFSAMAVKELQDGGYLDGLRPRGASVQIPGWDFAAVSALWGRRRQGTLPRPSAPTEVVPSGTAPDSWRMSTGRSRPWRPLRRRGAPRPPPTRGRQPRRGRQRTSLRSAGCW